MCANDGQTGVLRALRHLRGQTQPRAARQARQIPRERFRCERAGRKAQKRGSRLRESLRKRRVRKDHSQGIRSDGGIRLRTRGRDRHSIGPRGPSGGGKRLRAHPDEPFHGVPPKRVERADGQKNPFIHHHLQTAFLLERKGRAAQLVQLAACIHFGGGTALGRIDDGAGYRHAHFAVGEGQRHGLPLRKTGRHAHRDGPGRMCASPLQLEGIRQAGDLHAGLCFRIGPQTQGSRASCGNIRAGVAQVVGFARAAKLQTVTVVKCAVHMQRGQTALNGLHLAQRQALVAHAVRGDQVRILCAQNMAAREAAAVENL